MTLQSKILKVMFWVALLAILLAVAIHADIV
jgi:Ni/Fe-hydrogenase subunit HybB-like protein